nr:hypothetical protein HK105_000560 [Polyrhizophydium stewartii]
MGDLSKAVGFELASLPVGWNQRDLLLYAATIGTRADELNLNYELHPKWAPFPTYPLVLGLKGDSQTITDFAKMVSHGGDIPLPPFDRTRVVHAEQTIQVLKPIPANSGPGWKITKRVTGIKDTGKGIIMEQENCLVSPSGEIHTRMFGSSFYVGATHQKGFSKFIVQKPEGANPPSRAPDMDPKLGKSMGFGGVILHGLCFYGFAAHAVLAHFGNSDPSRFVSMAARFASPVVPGQTVETLAWKESRADGDYITFIQRIKETGKVNLSNGLIVLKPASAGARL